MAGFEENSAPWNRTATDEAHYQFSPPLQTDTGRLSPIFSIQVIKVVGLNPNNSTALFLADKRERIESGHFEDADFRLRWQQKELHLTAVRAYDAGGVRPLTYVAKEIYRLSMWDGNGEKVFSAICGCLAKERRATSTTP